MDDILSTYKPAQAYDEMFSSPGVTRALYDGVAEALRPMGPSDLQLRADQLARTFTERGADEGELTRDRRRAAVDFLGGETSAEGVPDVKDALGAGRD